MMRYTIVLLTTVLILGGIVLLFRSPPPDAQRSVAADARDSTEKEEILQFWENYRLATDYRLAGRLDRAEAHYRQALRLNDDHEDANYYIGNVYLEQGRYAEAEARWLHLSRLNPNSARAYSQLGILYLCAGDTAYFDLDAARAAFERALEINKEETGSLLRLGQIALLQGNVSVAAYYFDAVTSSNDESREAYFYGGFAAWKEGSLEKAAERFTRSVVLSKAPRQSDGVVGEGDTREGRSPASRRTSCRLFEDQLEDLASFSETVPLDQVNQRYTRLEAFLDSFERVPHD